MQSHDTMTLDRPGPNLDGLKTLRDVHAVYQTLAAERGAPPTRRDLDPLRFGRLLPSLMLLEVHRDVGRLRVRLAGEVIERNSGVPVMRGAWIDETQKDPATAAAAFDGVVTALDSGTPRLVERRIERPDGLDLRYCALTLPLSRIAGEPDMALIAVQYR